MTVSSVIVGAGPVGLALALALAKKGHEITLVDRAAASPFHDGRTLALAQGSRRILEDLDVWTDLEDHAHPIHDILVSQENGRGHVRYKSKDVSDAPMGHLIPMERLQDALMSKVLAKDSITLKRPFLPKSLTQTKDGISLEAEDSSILGARWCFGVDGRTSWVREHLGFTTRSWNYDQVGIVATLSHAHPHEGVAYEHFLRSGPVAFLPLTSHESALVWSQPPAHARYLMGLEDTAFCALLEHVFPFLGSLSLMNPRKAYPLAGHFVTKSAMGRTLLVGDAAHGIHPVAGQGFNLGLRDVAWFLEQAPHVFEKEAHVLTQTYIRRRMPDVVSMTAMTHVLVKLFSNESHTLKHLRGLGLGIVNRIPPLKNLLTRHAMGLPLQSHTHTKIN